MRDTEASSSPNESRAVGSSFAATATYPIHKDVPIGPLPDAFGHLIRGELSTNDVSYDYLHPWHERYAWNLGELVGIPRGLATLIPLALVWIGVVVAWRRWARVSR